MEEKEKEKEEQLTFAAHGDRIGDADRVVLPC